MHQARARRGISALCHAAIDGVRGLSYDRHKAEHRVERVAGSVRVDSRPSRVFGAVVLALVFAMPAMAQDMRIQFAEKVAIPAAPGLVEFDAYGRRFSLDLVTNDRLLRSLSAANKQAIDPRRLRTGRRGSRTEDSSDDETAGVLPSFFGGSVWQRLSKAATSCAVW